MATATAKLAPETTEAPGGGRGFPGLPCPRCGEADGIHLHLDDLSGDEAFSCGECEATFGAADVRDLLARWSAVLAWVDLAPAAVEG